MAFDPATELLLTALDQSIEGIQVIDSDWRYIFVNQAAAAQGRSTREALTGRTMMECYPGIETQPFFEHLRAVATQGTPRRLENEFTYPDGSKGWFELRIEPHQSGVLIRSLDISDRKRLEDDLRHAYKMEAVGRLAGGVAHDFNNKLSIMMAFCELLMDRIQAVPEATRDTTAQGYLTKLFTAIEQSAALTRQLLAFSRKQVLLPRSVDLNKTLVQSGEGLNRLIGAHIEIDYELADSLDPIQIDPTQLDQILLNLAANARDAMPDGGKIHIETSNVDLSEAFAREHGEMDAGPHVLLRFSDTGCGIPKDVLSKIFDPFFSTKGQGLGTGLGLAMVHGIVRQSRGHITVFSEPGAGITFKIYLPKAKETVAEEGIQAAVAPARGGHETLLLVEDDEMLREAYERVLTDSGYHVLAVRNPTEAESIFHTEHAKLDLLLTDVLLPVMSGIELSKRLKELKPDLKVLFMSGYTESALGQQNLLAPDATLIQKPVSIHTLQVTVRKVLDGEQEPGIIHGVAKATKGGNKK